MRIEAKLEELGLVLPEPTQIPPEMQVSFAWVRVHQDRAYISGQGPQHPDGSIAHGVADGLRLGQRRTRLRPNDQRDKRLLGPDRRAVRFGGGDARANGTGAGDATAGGAGHHRGGGGNQHLRPSPPITCSIAQTNGEGYKTRKIR